MLNAMPSPEPNQPFEPARFLLAIALLAGGVALSQFGKGGLEQAMISFAAGLVAVVAMIDLASPAKRNPQAASPIREPETRLITQHPDFGPFIDALADPVIVLSGTQVRRVNRAAIGLLGEPLIGQDIRLAIRHPAAADLLAGPDIATNNDQPIELIGIGSRDQRWQMLVRDLPGNERVLFLWDRSGMHAVEQMRTDFVANASHELRTPLASIKGFIETLMDSEAGGDPEVRARFLAVMDREANRMQKLIDDLISLSRIEADKFRLPDTLVDLPELMRDVQTIFAQSQDQRGQDIVLDIAENLPALRGDRAQLSQVLHNLVSNSMKYGQAGTPITLSLRPSRNRAFVRLSVSDRGEGIAPEHLPRLTERFYRVDSSRSRAIGGTGLGLSIVKHIVERHRGRLEIDSVPQRGTTITITLPADARSDTPQAFKPTSEAESPIV